MSKQTTTTQSAPSVVSRLTPQATGQTPECRTKYTYDLVGNRLTRASASGLLTNQNITFDVNDWLDNDSVTTNANPWFDANGNTRTNGPNLFEYNWANQITNAVIGGTNVRIVYDAHEHCVRKTVVVGTTTNTTLYLVDDRNPTGHAQVMEEWTALNSQPATLSRSYTYGLDLISQRESSGTVLFFVTDGLGSTRALVDTNGWMANTFAYEAYATLIGSNGTPQTVYLFAGEQWDADLGMYFLRARYYQPQTGRFWTMDSEEGNNEDPLSLHKYLYAADTPVNNIDPSGHNTDAISFNISANMAIGLAAFSAAAVYDAKTHAIGNLMVAAGGAAGELLDEASVGAQNAMAAAEAAVLASYRSLSDAISKAKEAAKDLANRPSRNTPPKVVPIPASVIPSVAAHVSSAQAMNAAWYVLTRADSKTAKLNRERAIGGVPAAGIGPGWVPWSLDEYPFASSYQGGFGASVAAVPLHENLVQGGIIAASYALEKIKVGDSYLVIVIP